MKQSIKSRFNLYLLLFTFLLNTIPLHTFAQDIPSIDENALVDMSAQDLSVMIQEKLSQIAILKRDLAQSQLVIYDNSENRFIIQTDISNYLGLVGMFGLFSNAINKVNLTEAKQFTLRKRAAQFVEQIEHINPHLSTYKKLKLKLNKHLTHTKIISSLIYAMLVSISIAAPFINQMSPPDIKIISLTESEKKLLEQTIARLENDLNILKKAIVKVVKSNLIILN